MYSSHQDMERETLCVSSALRVDVLTLRDTIVGFPAWIGEDVSHVAMYSGRPIGVVATEEGVREERFPAGGKIVVNTPWGERCRRRRARRVDW